MWYNLQSVDPRGMGTFQRELMLSRLEVRTWESFKLLLFAFTAITVYVYGTRVESWSRKMILKSDSLILLHLLSGMNF